MVIYLLLAVFLITVIYIFSSTRLSPIPYFPSNKKDMKLILDSLSLKNNQTVIDLGAGDGIVIFEAAVLALSKGLDTEFVAVEINPILIVVLYLKRLFNPNRKNIRIIKDDMFVMDYAPYLKPKNNLVFYIYISPWYIEKTLANIKKQAKKFSVVSYMYSVKSMKAEAQFAGLHKVFVYNKNK